MLSRSSLDLRVPFTEFYISQRKVHCNAILNNDHIAPTHTHTYTERDDCYKQCVEVAQVAQRIAIAGFVTRRAQRQVCPDSASLPCCTRLTTQAPLLIGISGSRLLPDVSHRCIQGKPLRRNRRRRCCCCVCPTAQARGTQSRNGSTGATPSIASIYSTADRAQRRTGHGVVRCRVVSTARQMYAAGGAEQALSCASRCCSRWATAKKAVIIPLRTHNHDCTQPTDCPQRTCGKSCVVCRCC